MLASYVLYKGDLYLVIGINGNLVKLWSPMNKVQVLIGNTQPTPYRSASVITYKGANYIATDVGNVISLTTGKLMSENSEQYREVRALLLKCEEM